MKLWISIAAGLCLLGPAFASGQEDQTPLGDLARQLRQNKAPGPEAPIIDNENLAQATEEAKNRRPQDHEKFVLSIDPAGKIKASSPDVSCSLSFNARAGALLVKPVLLETLPLPELIKIDGPGSIQDQNLELELFNGTEWQLQEITVGLTLERKPGQGAELAAHARVIPASENSLVSTIEKRSDVTLLYHLKADAKPFATATLKENIGITPGPDEDWRWSIVEAKGIRPQEVILLPNQIPPPPALSLPIPAPPPATTQAPALPNKEGSSTSASPPSEKPAFEPSPERRTPDKP